MVKQPKGKTAGADGSIRMGIDKFINDPGRTVANYYNDKIDRLKDYINTMNLTENCIFYFQTQKKKFLINKSNQVIE